MLSHAIIGLSLLATQPVFSNAFSTSNSFEVASYSNIIYIQELESLHVHITEDNILQARSDAEANPMSTAIIAQNVEICVLSNNKNGMFINVAPVSTGTLSAQQTGQRQDRLTNGDNLLFYKPNYTSI